MELQFALGLFAGVVLVWTAEAFGDLVDLLLQYRKNKKRGERFQ